MAGTRFVLHDLDSPVLVSGDKVTFRAERTDGPYYLQAHYDADHANPVMRAQGQVEGPDEIFIIEKSGGTGVIRDGDVVTIRTIDPKYYAAAVDAVTATSSCTARLEWPRFLGMVHGRRDPLASVPTRGRASNPPPSRVAACAVVGISIARL
jgi:hypothetical protein